MKELITMTRSLHTKTATPMAWVASNRPVQPSRPQPLRRSFPRPSHGRSRPLRPIAALSLLFCSGTLVCCALPAFLVLLGAGSVMASLLSWFPGLVLLSEQKLLVFALAAAALIAAGHSLYRSNRGSCPLDPQEAARCRRRLRQARWLYLASCSAFLTGGTVAYVLPLVLSH